MTRTRRVVLVLGLFVPMAVDSRGGESRAMAALNHQGLARSGRLVVLDAEGPLLEKWKSTRAVLSRYAGAVARKGEADRGVRGVRPVLPGDRVVSGRTALGLEDGLVRA